MFDDDPDTHRWPEGAESEPPSTQADDSFDPFGTRPPEASDPFATRADGSSSTWSNEAGGSSDVMGSFSPSVPRYRILRAHARGALGEVFVAHDEELRREVALKEIQDRHADDPCSRARFLLEAEVTGSLEHPGIVPVYGLGHHSDGRPYYAMRFIRGGSLKEAIDRHHRPGAHRGDPSERALEFRTLLRRFIDICNAIAYAHSRDVLHRDLKPGNVMLGPYGETLVVDWGLAKSLSRPEIEADREEALRPMSADSSATVAGSIIGTPAFMSPEQAAGDLDRMGRPSDIYSLGATLYCMLTGKTPFDGRDVGEILARVQKGDFPPPRKVRREIPRALEAIVLKAMATRPEDRYPTARALASDVEHWLAGASVEAYPDWFAVKLWRWCLRRPILSTAAVAGLFLDVICGVLFLLAYVQSVLHAGSMPRLNAAAAALTVSPFVAQFGALIGSALGAAIGGAWRRSLAGLYRGAAIGLKVGVPTALAVLLFYGVFEIARPPEWMRFRTAERPLAESMEVWPKLPGSTLEALAWTTPEPPVDLAGFCDDPPVEENAAPLYLDALFEFDDGMASCFSNDEGRRRAETTRDRLDKFQRINSDWRADPDTVDRAALDALLEEYEVGFLKIRLAQRRPQCVFRTGRGLGAALSHAQAARKVAQVTALRVLRKLELGETARAIDDFETLLRLGRDLQPRGDLITQLVSVAIESFGRDEILLPILLEPRLRVEQCDRLLAILETHSSAAIDPFVEGFQAEYVRTGHSVHTAVDQLVREERLGGSRARSALRSLLAYGPAVPKGTDPESKAQMARFEAKIDAHLSQMTPRQFAETSYRSHDAYYRAALKLAGRPWIERIEAVDALASKTFADQPLLLALAPAGKAFVQAIGRAEARRNAMKCLVALRRWELAGRGEPTNLEDVVRAARMAKVPTDPFRLDGGPLRLVLIQGEPIVYSVGPDGRNNGGTIAAQSGVDPQGDDLYRLKPPRAAESP